MVLSSQAQPAEGGAGKVHLLIMDSSFVCVSSC